MRKTGYFVLVMFIYIFLLMLSFSHADDVSGYTFQHWGEDTFMRLEADFARSDGLYQHSLTQTFSDYAWGQGVMANALMAAAKVDPSWLPIAIKQADEFHLRYWCTQNSTSGYNASYGNCGDRYYDDNAWIALGLLELYQLTGNTKYLGWAQDTIAFCMTGENGPGDTPDGGIRWHESNTSGASICSTAPTCLANLITYQLSGDQLYLTDGMRLYNWLITADAYRTSSGLFHETNQGVLGYLTGVVTQAALRVYQITGNTSHLSEAQSMAAAMEIQFINQTTLALKQTGKWGGHDMTNAYVNLYQVDRNTHWLDVVKNYLVYLHDNCEVDGLYPEFWDGRDSSVSPYLIESASAARAFWKIASVIGGTTTSVRLYQHCPYGGWMAKFSVGAYTAADIIAAGGLDNDASSVQIDPGYIVTFYSGDNFTGSTLVKTADVSCLVNDGWNDRISSMIIDVNPVLLGHWQFNDNTGIVAADASGYAHDAELTNMDSTAWNLGKQCSSLSFDGVDDFLQIPEDGLFNLNTNSWSVAFWLRSGTPNQGTAIISKRANIAPFPQYSIGLSVGNSYAWTPGRKLTFLFREATGIEKGGYTASEIDISHWTHVCVAFDRPANMVYVYINGVSVPVIIDHDGTLPVIINNSPLYIGGNPNMSNLFQGSIDEVRTYNYALAPAQVQALYQMHALAADTEPDGDVDLNDFAALASSWHVPDSCDADLTCDCVVDVDDLMILLSEWLRAN